jgi:hypothetical protein
VLSWPSLRSAVPCFRSTLTLPLMAILVGVLSACGSDGGNAGDAPVTNFGPLFGVTTSPAITPAFDPSIHDYTINCATTPTVQLKVQSPEQIGFTYLGTNANPVSVQPGGSGAYTQSANLLPNQRLMFSTVVGTYSVRCVPTDFPPLTASRTGVPQAQWYVFAPTIGTPAPTSYVIIADSHGTPVWWMTEPTGEAINAQIWSGTSIGWTIAAVEGLGYPFVIRDFSGNVIQTFGETLGLDEHELIPSGTGTYYAIRTLPRTCPPDCADLSPWGGSASTSVLDALIYELDENSNILWTWRTRDHIDLAEYGETGWLPSMGIDIIHMNAIEPDGPDNLMFSARHLNAVYHITKSTGAIDWKLGGTPRAESLTVVGETRPTATGVETLSGQHDIRRWPDGTISVHDNGTLANRAPAIVRYNVDPVAKTASVVQQLSDVRAPLSGCCGSARLLPGGHWVAAWGENTFWTELDETGNPVLTINYNLPGSAFSYRTFPTLSGVVSAEQLRQGMDAMSAAATPN